MADETEPQDLSHLSPSAVLGDRSVLNSDASTPPVESVPPLITALSRDELLKQAAEAPDTELILPPPILPTEAPVVLRQSPPRPLISHLLPTPPELPQSATVLPEPPPPVATLPEPPAPPLAVPEHIVMQGPDIETMHAHRKRAPVSGLSKIIAAIGGGIVLLCLIAGILYVLTLRGARIPLLYSAVSHLAANGMAERDLAVKTVSSASSYRYAPNSQISLKLKSGAPTSLDNAVISPVSSVVTTLEVAQATLPAEQLSAKVSLNGSGTVQVPLVYASGEPNWSVRLPLNADHPTRQVLASELRSSFLPVLIQPLRLSTILKSATAVTAYRQEIRNGQRTAVYTYSLDPKLLATGLPNGVSSSDPSATIAYAWNSDRPLSSELATVLTQGKVSYSYLSSLTYQDWNLALQNDALNGLTNSAGSNLAVADLIAQLGFAVGSLPTSLTAVAPTASATPVPSASPSPSATVRPVMALIPTGQSTTQLMAGITATPPPPPSTATAQMISDDTQRKNDLQLLQSVLERYKTDKKAYPKSSGLEQVQASQTLFTALLPDYLTAMPIDPSRTAFWYEYSSDGLTFSLRSVAQNPADPLAKQGVSYHYFEYFNAKS